MAKTYIIGRSEVRGGDVTEYLEMTFKELNAYFKEILERGYGIWKKNGGNLEALNNGYHYIKDGYEKTRDAREMLVYIRSALANIHKEDGGNVDNCWWDLYKVN